MEKPKIIVDVHEKKSEVFEYIVKSDEISYDVKPLYIGDYISGGVVIERKTLSDFLSSLANGRIQEQLKKLRETDKRIILVEGSFHYLNKLDKRKIYGKIVSILLYSNMKIIFTENASESYQYLVVLAKQKMQSNERFLDIVQKRIQKPNEELRHSVISNIQGIGPKSATKLFEKFGSIQSIVNAKKEKLEEIIGRRTDKFLEIVRG